MQVHVNGRETEIDERLTVADLVVQLGLNPDIIVVEHNMVILPKEEWPQMALSSEDKLEIITFVGGG